MKKRRGYTARRAREARQAEAGRLVSEAMGQMLSAEQKLKRAHSMTPAAEPLFDSIGRLRSLRTMIRETYNAQ